MPTSTTSIVTCDIRQRETVPLCRNARDVAPHTRVLPNRRVDIRYQPSGMAQAALPLFQYWRNSAPARYARIVPEYAALITRARDAHAAMIDAAGADELIRQNGYLEVFRTADAFDAECRQAEQDADEYGVTHDTLDSATLAQREPDLAPGLAGAIHWTQPWTATDPGALVAAYADHFQQQGGRFVQAPLETLSRHGNGWQAVVGGDTFAAEQVVLALGPWSTQWLDQQRLHVPLFVKRGYHMHYGARDNARLPHWLTDSDTGHLPPPQPAGHHLHHGPQLARPHPRPPPAPSCGPRMRSPGCSLLAAPGGSSVRLGRPSARRRCT